MTTTTRPKIEHDDADGVTVIEGVRYSNFLFQTFGGLIGAPVGSFIMIEGRKDGTLTVRRFSADLEARFREVARLHP